MERRKPRSKIPSQQTAALTSSSTPVSSLRLPESGEILNLEPLGNIEQLKEIIHQLQLKDAITRQELSKAERVKKELSDIKLSIQSDIQRLEKELTQEDRMLQRQEDDLVNIKSKDSIPYKPHRHYASEITFTTEKCRAWIKEMETIHNDETQAHIRTQHNFGNLERDLKRNGDSREIIETMKELINDYESLLALKDSKARVESAFLYQDVEVLKRNYSDEANILEGLRATAFKFQKERYEVEKRVKECCNDEKIEKGLNDKPAEADALQAANQILVRLKEKLGKSNETSPFLTKINQQVNIHKNRVQL
ncbi:unnamed protein product [Blepharisma stoltei]|uniref:Uncharacterized protein n=1 Tax=Blepharisma stoltei TaxID=1481888 RepID=A0AAU9J6M3_9CILI|nr:unnamed protein product [Blepharisma stoltei]